ncbi:hypothetical protein CC86DRAFT_377663 [Ophiobolus disseminans]|uniref:Endonuclease/exonuclease/phosphatase domain-containing protein n=1 Tax=Ophiobolus disseminans TaxID=1469910 RepID=A0A6A7AIT7_9PLEO|nr:hypothetical protein CC86DRAFT_377663 [Ophiobolus disseminans]
MTNSNAPQHLGDGHNWPRDQNYWHATQHGEWLSTAQIAPTHSDQTEAPVNPKAIRLLSWNIDFRVGFGRERMASALHYLGKLVTSTSPEVPIVIFFQEMVSSDLEQIQESDWVKRHFYVTDHDNQNWESLTYGTTTLVDRRLSIQSVFRVPWHSGMGRDGLFVDLALSNAQQPDVDAKTLRLCNTHLESLAADPPIRPLQLAAAAQYLNRVVYVPCTLLAGDLNAIQSFDRALPSLNELTDTYLELGGQEDTEEGYTWGPQARKWSREQFGSSRMDKILFSGCLQPKNFSRIGMGLKVADDVLEEVEREVEGGFVTDHYGVMGEFELTEGWRFVGSDSERSVENGSEIS